MASSVDQRKNSDVGFIRWYILLLCLVNIGKFNKYVRTVLHRFTKLFKSNSTDQQGCNPEDKYGHDTSLASCAVTMSVQLQSPEQNQAVVQHMLVTSFSKCISAIETLEAYEQIEDPTNNMNYSEATALYYKDNKKRNRTKDDVLYISALHELAQRTIIMIDTYICIQIQVEAQVRLTLSTMDGLLYTLPQQHVQLQREPLVEKAERWMKASESRISPNITEYQQQFLAIIKGDEEKMDWEDDQTLETKTKSDSKTVEDNPIATMKDKRSAHKTSTPETDKGEKKKTKRSPPEVDIRKPLSGEVINEAFGCFQHGMQIALKETDDVITGRKKPVDVENLRTRGDLS